MVAHVRLMELKRNSLLAILFLLMFNALFAQTGEETYTDEVTEVIEEDTFKHTSYYASFDDSARNVFQNQRLVKPIPKDVWESVYKGVSFDTGKEKEEHMKPEKPDSKRQSESPFKINTSSSNNLSWLWYALAFAMMVTLIIFLYPRIGAWNIRNKENPELLFGDDNPDENALNLIDLRKPYMKAYEDGDYKMAFRLRYLDLLKQLSQRNWIVYKKEKTNFDYLMQLMSKPVYQPFSRLTMAFDEIWYGEILPNKAQFDHYMALFDEVGREVGNA